MNEEELKALIDKSVPGAIMKALEEKLPTFIDAVKAGAKENELLMAKAEGKKSVMRSPEAGSLAWRAPFVSVGEEVKEFIGHLRALASGKAIEKAVFDITNDEEGGYLVPEEIDMAIFAYERQVSVLRSRGASVFTTKGNTRMFNKLDQSSNNFGGVSFDWVDEGGSISDTGAKVGQIKLTVKKLMALTSQSSEFLQDADTNAANFLIQLFGEAAAYAEDLAFFQGSGLGRPQGIIKHPNVQSVNRAVANQIAFADVEAMYFKIPASIRGRAVWFANTDAVKYVSGLKDANNRPLMAESTMALANYATPVVLKGLPLVELTESYLPALGTKGDLTLVVPSHYFILDKGGLSIAVSPHSRFRYDEIEWRFTKRVDGQLAGAKSAVVLDVP